MLLTSSGNEVEKHISRLHLIEIQIQIMQMEPYQFCALIFDFLTGHNIHVLFIALYCHSC